jgi:hypothetical protein
MKKYRVVFMQETFYTIDIEAEDEETAFEIAIECDYEDFREGDSEFKYLEIKEINQ